MRRPMIAGNWKMHSTIDDTIKFAGGLASELKASGQIDVVIAPPFTSLYSLGVALSDTEFKMASQNIFWEDNGAYTAEVSGVFLKDVGCHYAIIGHSERRQYFNETDETVNKRIFAAIRNQLTPIFCIGETLAQRDADNTWNVLETQLRSGLKGIKLAELDDFIIAYEPVWAIGTGETATPEQAQEVHRKIRTYLSDIYGIEVSDKIRLLYGGSVKPSNSRELLTQSDIDGALVGGASLDPKSFAEIVRSAH